MKALLVLLLAAPLWAADLTVYTYDSFNGKDTLGAWMQARSLASTGCQTKYKVFPSAGEALNQVAVEADKPQADIVVGIDQSLLARAEEIGGFEPLGPTARYSVNPALFFDTAPHFIPFNYGYLALVYDDRRKNGPPTALSFQAFSHDPKYAKRLVLEDARTSSLGRSLVGWTKTVFPGEFEAFWRRMGTRALTTVPGWSAAYGMFLSGEADFVFSYTTSPAYHVEKEKNAHIRAVLFTEGNYRQIETVAVRASSKQKGCARKWVDLLLSNEAQEALPLLQWMYPARRGVSLPASFQALPTPTKIVDDRRVTSQVNRQTLQDWARWISEK